MKRFRITVGVLASVVMFAGVATCEDQRLTVTVCQLKGDPAAYNHKLVEVTGFVSHAFEDFTLFDPTCSSWPGVWLEYGGKAKSGTMYCCGVSADRHRPKELKVEDISIPLTDDEPFRKFDKLIQPPFRSGIHGSIVHATLVGRFFSGRRIKYPKGSSWGGYGHMGRKAQGRYVYEWKPADKPETYMVVVSRPYLLAFYAHDPKRVAWVVAAAYASSCGKSNSVTRLK